ncbi:squalene/phytoene synthase family protein [Roseivivax isoporae]|uniref:Phytoene synthase n=1 Tax=Roseivivax isoporae LMG 25204 TaxID=1449351 RepID=X7FF49_9RHOB|nr:squalene/phytoene synthase family protein [Roseivivax isoporae]ETX30706.1 phytoene synthase [Roseivivax isoporae LMG 25204]
MQFDDDLNACAAAVERGDPDRFRAAMAAPVPARRVLFPIYAFNLEVARAPYVTQEPMIAQMRLQWWADALDEIASGGMVRRHEVATPLALAVGPEGAELLRPAVEARRRDADGSDPADAEDLEAYLSDTGGTLMWAAARALGSAREARVRALGTHLGFANYLLAVPELLRRNRQPFPDMSPGAIGAAVRSRLPLRADPDLAERPDAGARVAELSAWRVPAILARAARDPQAVLDGRLGGSEAGARLSLMLTAAGLRRLP